MSDAVRILSRFRLGEHRVELRIDEDDGLGLFVDGCLRKYRGAGGGPCYLWTNVELPFEDHHLIEVRRGPDATDRVDLSVKGTTLPEP